MLTEHRLLTVSAGAVEVAHEALLREWPRLRDWLDEDAEGRRLHRQLAQAASRWREGGRDRADLYRGARLASALEWRSGREPELDAGERRFLDASRAASEQARRRARVAFAGVVGLLVVAVAAAVLALESGDRARRQATAAEAQRLGAQALNEPTLDRSLLLARQGVALDDTAGTRDSLLEVLGRNPAAVGVMRGDGDGLAAAALHPDGHTLAVGDYNGSVAFLDAPNATADRETAPDRADRRDRVARVQPGRTPPRDRRADRAGRLRRVGRRASVPLHRAARSRRPALGARGRRAVLARLPRAGGPGVGRRVLRHPAAPLGRADGSADRRHPPDPRPGIEHARVPRRPAIGDDGARRIAPPSSATP